MSRRFRGAVISGTAPSISNTQASGVWTLRQNFQTISNQWPTEVLVPSPTFYLKFSDQRSLDSRVTFLRNGPATYFDQNGTMITAGNDTFRIDHDPLTGKNLGLLIESPQTNLCLRSEEFQTLWTQTNVSVVSNSILTLDEVNSGDSILETASTGEHLVQQNIVCNSTTENFSFSVFVKSINKSKGYIGMSIFATTTHSITCSFDLSTKTVSTSVTGSSVVQKSKITECRDGWFRISCTGKTGQSGSHAFSLGLLDDGGNANYTGNVSNGFYAWAYQVEQGNFSSSYIRTFGTTQSRLGDVITISGTNFSSWFNQSQGTFYINSKSLETGNTDRCMFEISDTTANENISCSINSQTTPSNKITFSVVDGGVSQTSINSIESTDGEESIIVCARYKNNDYKLSVNGVASTTDTAGTVPAVSTMNIASFRDSISGFFNGHILDFYYWNYNLPDEQLRLASSASYDDDKSLILEFNKMLELDNRISFSRLSTASYFNSEGILVTAISNQPRLDHDPNSGENLGLLLEENRTNVLSFSEQFENSYWTKSSVTITEDAATSPDGTSNADLMLEEATLAAHQLVRSETINSETANFTASIFVKPAGRNKGSLTINSSNNYFTTDFDLSQTTTSVSSSGTGAAVSSKIVSLINGWYRVIVTGKTGQNGETSFILRLNDDTVNLSYLGDNTKGMYVWGAQLEEGSFATSYIKTTTTAYTREDDVALLAGVNFSDWFNSIEGSFYWEGKLLGLSSNNQAALSISDGTVDEKITVFANFKPTSADNKISRAVVTDDSVDAVILNSPASLDNAVIDTNYRLSFGYKLNDFSLSLNSNADSTAITGTIPAVDRINIGSNHTGANTLNGHISRLYYWKTKQPEWAIATLKSKI
jgi:hypothetical protein